MIAVQGFGPLNAKIMMVGEAPGETEVKQGRPFVGNAGIALRRWMMEVGIDPDSVRFENLCKYRPPKNQLHQWVPNGQPNKLVMQGIMDLMDMIERVRPNLVVGLGAFPMHFLTGKGHWRKGKPGQSPGFAGISDWRGSILDNRLIPGIKTICTYHPSYLVRDGMKDHGTFLCDLQRIKEDGEFPEKRIPERELIVAPSGHNKHMAKERLLSGPKDQIITLDIEFIRRKQGKQGKLICVGMSTGKDWAVCFPTDLVSEIEFVASIIREGRPLNMQNSMFDASILEWFYGIETQPYVAYDTMVAAHASNIELPKSLDYLESIYTRQPNHKDMINWRDVIAGKQKFSDVYEYNCLDVAIQHEVMEEQLKWDLNDPQARQVFDFEMALLGPLWEVARRGVRLDHEHLLKLRLDLMIEIEAYRETLNAIAGRKINVKSPKDVAWLLHEKLGIKSTRQTKTGAAKTDDKTLASYLTKANAQQKVVIDLIRDIRNRRDLKSKFTDVELDEDQRSRGHYDPTKTVTGRLSSKKFFPTGRGHQQQNIPRDPRIRKAFIPDEGKRFGYADLERAESLVVAHITNDPLMLEHHAPGTDAHSSLAALLYNVPQEEVTKDQRYMGKQTRHAGNYMEGPETMKQNINQKAHITGVSVTYADCDKFIKMYRGLHIYLEPWWDDVERKLWDTRRLENLLGRYRIFYGHIKSIVPEAVAFAPQSTVGDTLNCGLLACNGKIVDYMRDRMVLTEAEIKELAATLKNDWGFEILNQVHDAIGYQYNIEHEFEVNSAIRKLLQVRLMAPKTYEEFVIPVEIAVGPSWGEVKVWADDLVKAA